MTRLRQSELAFASSVKAFAKARHLARHGHADRIVYRDRGGTWHVAIPSAPALKAALLAVGTAGHFSVISSKGICFRYNWPMALQWFRNARAGYA